MANEQHLIILQKGVKAWNDWIQGSFGTPAYQPPDLNGAILKQSDLRGINLFGANLHQAVLDGACLADAELSEADFAEASLVRSDMTGSNMWRTRFDRARLANANLTCANLSRAKLSETNLQDANLRAADFDRATLYRANLNNAVLQRADFTNANLENASLHGADLRGAHLEWCGLSEADLSDSDLRLAGLTGATLAGANISNALLGETVFADADLSNVVGLDSCRHNGPSVVDHRTLQRSRKLPLSFLRGVGVPDALMDYAASFGNAIKYYSCFISYSTKDQVFADRLHADLQNRGVRCWFAPHDMKIGAKILDTLDEAIRLRDKVLLIMSQNSLGSDWVEDEVSKAFAEERSRGKTVLFPIRLDDDVLTTAEPWATKLRDQRHIGDFTRWHEVDVYRERLDRLTRDLKVDE
jgi:uncharacterized protein YjbI with pentapeptide repeats